MSVTTREEYLKAVQDATEAAEIYYDENKNKVSAFEDEEWDALVDEIADYEAANPQDIITHALFTEVAAGTLSGGDVQHSTKMLSLKKARNRDELEAFIATTSGVLNVEPKLDGTALSLHYDKGSLVLAASRGDGGSGDDLTSRVLRQPIEGLPHKINTSVKNGTFEVRGEIYMTADDYEVATANRVASGEEPFAHSRNAASGVLRRETVDYTASLTFAAYDVVGLSDVSTSHNERMDILAGLGFATARNLIVPLVEDCETVSEKVDKFGDLRAMQSFPTDGVVIKADQDAERDRLGVGSRHPKWGIAFKYPDELVPSYLREIQYGIGRTGRLSLRGRIDRIYIDGTKVEYCSMHNVGDTLRKDVRVGDRVLMKRANGVIPQIEKVDLEARDVNSVPWTPPTVCPQCGEPFNKDNELWRCESAECSVLGRIVYAVHRDVFDIEGFSTALATALVESGRVSDISDLFTLTVDEIAQLPTGRVSTKTNEPIVFGVKTATKIHKEIEKAKQQPLGRVITALGIRGTGRSLSRNLAAHYHTMEAFRNADVESLKNIDLIGKEKSTLIYNEVRKMNDVIDRLAALGVNMGSEPSEDANEDGAATGDKPLAGMKVVVTGAMSGALESLNRNEMKELIISKGGTPSDSVSATSLLVAASTTSSKGKKALSLGAKIMSPEEFAALIGM